MNADRLPDDPSKETPAPHAHFGAERATEVQDLLPRAEAPNGPLSLLEDLAHRNVVGGTSDRWHADSLLILGNYRLLDRLGTGGMGTVFKAEHIHLKRPVAVKIVHSTHGPNSKVVQRFYAEMQTLAAIRHPNIVYALDAGEIPGTGADDATTYYLVMEFVPGQDLERLVRSRGPLPVEEACDLIHQVACALGEANRHQLIHRDIKPPNIVRMPEGQVKLLDFGLARHFRMRMTEPGVLLGTLDYMAPEQFEDAGAVDIRADIYGLGGTLYWCLTGQNPFPMQPTAIGDMSYRLLNPPPSARARRPEIPAELDAAVQRMLAPNPADRFASPEAVSLALKPFLVRHSSVTTPEFAAARLGEVFAIPPANAAEHVLIVDDEPSVRALCRMCLAGKGILCGEAANGQEALDAMARQTFDVVLADVDMPIMGGLELLVQIRLRGLSKYLKVIMISGGASGEEMASLLQAGADDYLTKPLSVVQLQSRVKAALALKKAQDEADTLNRHLRDVNLDLERSVAVGASSAAVAQQALVMTLGRTIEQRMPDRQGQSTRLQRLTRCLAEAAARTPEYNESLDLEFLDRLEWCMPLHDLGMIGLPDHLLLKPGKLDAEERTAMQTHATLGAALLADTAQRHGKAVDFLHTAAIIARYHHERWDGSGYPDGLAGADIPLAARIAALIDVYHALRSRRTYRPALTHRASVRIIAEIPGQFDPTLLHAFLECGEALDRVWSRGDGA